VKAPRANPYRDTWAGTIDKARTGDEVRVAGWVHRRRDHGGLIFIDLRDRSGLLQIVFHPETSPAAHEAAHRVRSEYVISVQGKVVEREEGNVNPNLPTGEVEIEVAAFDLLSESDTPPFPIDEDGPLEEGMRIKYRPLDLRRASMQRIMELRHAIVTTMRETLNERDFLEIETPDLTRSTPEGARDFLVPVRNPMGSFWALPQSPQLFKQLLMIAGYERYYQIARCFRDEDSRADRAPEFTQLDLEMAFVEEDDVIGTTEAVMAAVFEGSGFQTPPPPWRRLSYEEAMRRFGSDRPDLRFGLEIGDVSDAVRNAEFQVFSGTVASGGVVRGLNAGQLDAPRSELDELTELAKREGAKGLVWAFVQDDGLWRSPIAKFLTPDEMGAVTERLGGQPGDLLLVVADSALVAAEALGALRVALRDRHGLVPAGAPHEIFWVVDFPAFAWNGDEHRWDAIHHPFTAPIGDFDDPGSMTSRSYDLVLDGHEIGGGSIRISSLETQRKVFELLGISAQEAQARFGFLLDHLRFGAPPHGGIAMGLDRIVAHLAGSDSIRDAIAFPKTASGADPLTGAPAPVDDGQLHDLGLHVQRPPQT
jgi:aspartyl-tRNA synthetase